MWAMCRWRLSVKWKRHLVKRSIKWIRHGEGFIFFDGEGEFEPDAWGIGAVEFEEALSNVERFQEEKGDSVV